MNTTHSQNETKHDSAQVCMRILPHTHTHTAAFPASLNNIQCTVFIKEATFLK